MAPSIQLKLSSFEKAWKYDPNPREKTVNRNRYRNERNGGASRKGFKIAVKEDQIHTKKKSQLILKNAGKEGKRNKEQMAQIENKKQDGRLKPS